MADHEPEGFAPIVREKTNKSAKISRSWTNTSRLSKRRSNRAYDDSDEEQEASDPISSDWTMMPELKAFQKQGEKDAVKGRKLGVTWTNLTVKGVGADAAINENVGSQFNIPRAIKEGKNKEPLKTIIENSHGCVKPGEMLLVLGRPGSGCTSLLKMLANKRLGYAEVTGDVKWGTMDPKQAEQFRGQIVMNTEEELFFPTLTVGETIDFATRMKVSIFLVEELTSHLSHEFFSAARSG